MHRRAEAYNYSPVRAWLKTNDAAYSERLLNNSIIVYGSEVGSIVEFGYRLSMAGNTVIYRVVATRFNPNGFCPFVMILTYILFK